MAPIFSLAREQTAFDPEATALAISAYDKAMAELHGAPAVVREVVAKHIIQLLAHGERDADALCKRALTSAGIPAIDR